MNIDVMSASYIQAERIIRVETALGPDVLLPERLSMREKVSGLFELTIAVNSKRTDIAPDELVGKLADVSVDTGFGDRRTWNGLVTDLIEGPGVTRGLRAYTLVLRPEHWLLSQRSDCRIWLDKTSVEVAQILMGEHQLASPVIAGHHHAAARAALFGAVQRDGPRLSDAPSGGGRDLLLVRA